MNETIKFRKISGKNSKKKILIAASLLTVLAFISYVKIREALVSNREKKIFLYETEISALEIEYKLRLEELQKEYEGKILEKKQQLEDTRKSLEKLK
jgi:hypothetical protein